MVLHVLPQSHSTITFAGPNSHTLASPRFAHAGRGASLPLTRNARIILIHACLLALPFAFLLPSASLAMLARRGLPQGLA